MLIFSFTLVFGGCEPSGEETYKVKEPEEKYELEPEPEREPEREYEEVVLWSEAKNHIGEILTVYGPVISTYYASTSKGQPTFINIGKAYPDPERFTVVIWGQNRPNFPQAPEVYYSGKIIYVTGLIEEYEGVAEIVVSSPSQIEE